MTVLNGFGVYDREEQHNQAYMLRKSIPNYMSSMIERTTNGGEDGGDDGGEDGDDGNVTIVFYTNNAWDEGRIKWVTGHGKASNNPKCHILYTNSFGLQPLYHRGGTIDAIVLAESTTPLEVLQTLQKAQNFYQPMFLLAEHEAPALTWRNPKQFIGFSGLISYSKQSTIYGPWGKTIEGVSSPTASYPNPRSTTKLGMIMISNCIATARKDILLSVMEHIPIEVYGDCQFGNNTHGRIPANDNQVVVDIMRQHKFYFAFESEVCDDYITEKFWRPLVVGLIPVVHGLNKTVYEKIAPPNSFVHIEEFAGPKALAEGLQRIADDEEVYWEYHKWRRNYAVVYGRCTPRIFVDG